MAGSPDARPSRTVNDPSKAHKAGKQDAVPVTFAQRLAHPDKKTRDANLRALSSYIQRRAALSPVDIQKLWKGLFYCFWLSDKVLVQQELARRLASMQESLAVQRWDDWLRGFYLTMRREWDGIDRLRMDKFMSLARAMLHHSLRYVALKHRWREDVVQRLARLHSDLPLHSGNEQRGLALHITDCFVPELAKVAEDAASLPYPALRALLDPFYAILASSTDRALVRRIQEEVFEQLHTAASQPAGGGFGVLPEVVVANASAMAEQLMNVASNKSTADKHRAALYGLRDSFQSLLPQLDRSRVEEGKSRKRKAAGILTVDRTGKKKRRDDDDVVPMLVELPLESAAVPAVPADGAKQGRNEREGQVQAAVQSSVFADVEEFDVPEFGFDDGEEEEEDGKEEVNEDEVDDLTVILQAEGEEDGEDEELMAQAFANDFGDDTGTGIGDEEDEGEFLDAAAFERSMAQEEAKQERAEKRKIKSRAEQGKQAVLSAQAEVKEAALPRKKVKRGEKNAEAAVPMREAEETKEAAVEVEASARHGKKKKKKTKNNKRADSVSAVTNREDGDEEEKRADDVRLPQKKRNKSKKRVVEETEAAAAEEKSTQEARRNAANKTAKRMHDGGAASSSLHHPATEAASQESVNLLSNGFAHHNHSHNHNQTENDQHRQRKRKKASKEDEAAESGGAVSSSSSTPLSVSVSESSLPAKSVRISLEHNRVQTFHHWKKLDVTQPTDSLLSKPSPKPAIKQRHSLDSNPAPAPALPAAKKGKARLSLPVMPSAVPMKVNLPLSPSPRNRPTAADFF